ncbi:glycosyltransferase [Pontibacter ramchanderi]|nr:glycosyltransferase [Pontibacter ramchanderi]
MANEEKDFSPFVNALTVVLNEMQSGRVYLIVDNASKDRTLHLCQDLAMQDNRFVAVWAPESKNVVDAYLIGYRNAATAKHEYIIEMDAGLSHDPKSLRHLLNPLVQGYDCTFGSRFTKGGAILDTNLKRTVLSKGGTLLTNLLLGTKLKDMTSGYQGFRLEVVERFLTYKLLSKAHFYQTELRYLLRKTRYIEVPIHYRSPSPRVSKKAVKNALHVLLYYFRKRILFKSISL